jgi:hypothetical protein
VLATLGTMLLPGAVVASPPAVQWAGVYMEASIAVVAVPAHSRSKGTAEATAKSVVLIGWGPYDCVAADSATGPGLHAV